MSLNCMSKGLTWKKCCSAVAKISRCWVYAIGRQGMPIVGDEGGGGGPQPQALSDSSNCWVFELWGMVQLLFLLSN